VTFRDDREALEQRADALEADLAEANRLLAEVREQLISEKKEGQEADQRLGELEGQVNGLRKKLGLQALPLSRKKPDPMGPVAVIGLLSLVVLALVLVGGVLMLAFSDPTAEPSPYMPLVFGGVFSLFGLPMVLMGLATFAKDRDIKKWPVATGTIHSSSIESFTVTDKDQSGYYRTYESFHPDVTYRYTVDGTEHACSGVTRAEESTTDRAAVQACIDRYPPGKEVKVLYDPDDPATAYLEVHSSTGGWIILLFGLLFMGIGVGVASIFFAS
jgi:hypothetical protein